MSLFELFETWNRRQRQRIKNKNSGRLTWISYSFIMRWAEITWSNTQQVHVKIEFKKNIDLLVLLNHEPRPPISSHTGTGTGNPSPFRHAISISLKSPFNSFKPFRLFNKHFRSSKNRRRKAAKLNLSLMLGTNLGTSRLYGKKAIGSLSIH